MNDRARIGRMTRHSGLARLAVMSCVLAASGVMVTVGAPSVMAGAVRVVLREDVPIKVEGQDVYLLPGKTPAAEGKVSGHAAGGYVVDVAWRGGRLESFRVTPERDGEVRVHYAGRTATVSGRAGAPITEWEAPVIEGALLRRVGDAIEVAIDGKPFTTFVTTNVAKPHLYPVIGPGGQRITRGFPMDPRADEERDHPHHTSIWFAHGDVNGADFWTGANNAKIVAQSAPVMERDGAAAVIKAEFHWVGGDEKPLCAERRTMRFSGDGTRRIIDFDFELRSLQPLKFGDTKEGTFGVRLVPTLQLKGKVAKGAILNSEGVRDAACWGKRAKWVQYVGPVEGETVSVVMFDHPENPRHPTWWHARDYGLFAANPFGAHDFEGQPRGTGDLTLENGATLRLRYRLMIHTGSPGASEWDAMFKDYASAASEADR